MDEHYWHDLYVEGEIHHKYMEIYAKERERIFETYDFDETGRRLEALSRWVADQVEHELRKALYRAPTRWEAIL